MRCLLWPLTHQWVRQFLQIRTSALLKSRTHDALDEEWDIERAIEANASTLALFGALMAALRRDNRWLALPIAVTAFLLQHAIQGWCPPVPVLRRLGFRTSYEIEEEREALKALRGDFKLEGAPDRAAAALDAARA